MAGVITEAEIDAEAYAAYQKNGMQGVEDVARKYNIKTRTNCVPCEANTPYFRGSCLTCGSIATPIKE